MRVYRAYIVDKHNTMEEKAVIGYFSERLAALQACALHAKMNVLDRTVDHDEYHYKNNYNTIQEIDVDPRSNLKEYLDTER